MIDTGASGTVIQAGVAARQRVPELTQVGRSEIAVVQLQGNAHAEITGATGSFTVERLFNLATLTTTGSFEGTISSPGAVEP